MSGHKHATVSLKEDEYHRLHQAEMRLRFFQQDMPGMIEQISRQTEKNLAVYYASQRQRQEEFSIALQGLNADLEAREAYSSQDILAHQPELLQELQHLSDGSLNHMMDLLTHYEAEQQEKINAIQRTNQDEITRLEKHLDKIVSSNHEKMERAEEWLNVGQRMLHFILEHYPLQLLTPGEVDSLEAQLQQAQTNLEAGMPEAACLAAQQSTMRLSALRLELEGLQSQRELLYQRVQGYLHSLIVRTLNNRHIQACNLDWQEVPVQIEVDYWVNGALSHLYRKVKSFTRQVVEGRDDLTINELHHLLDDTLPGLDHQLKECIYQARVNVLNSQLRFNIADLAVQALACQGYTLQQASFEQEDARGIYFAHLKSLDGSEIVVQVAPKNETPGQNELHLIASDNTQSTAHEVRLRSQEISRALTQAGLEVGALQVELPTIDSPIRDPEPTPVRQKQNIRSR